MLAVGAAVFIALVLVLRQAINPSPSGGGGRDTRSQYGGSPSVYAQIAAETDCQSLQAMFDQAAANNDRAVPGTDQHKWTLGYMTAAQERMQAVGCH